MASPRKNHPCLCNISRNLRFERIGAREDHFFAQEAKMGNFKFLSVKIAVKIEKMDFERIDAIGSKSGAPPKIENSLMDGLVLAHANARGIDAARRKKLFDIGEIGGRKTQEPSTRVPFHDSSGNGVRAAQKPRRLGEEPLRNRAADAGAAHRLAIQLNRGNDLYGDVAAIGKLGETGGIPFAVPAKGPILPDGRVPEFGKNAGDLADELRG